MQCCKPTNIKIVVCIHVTYTMKHADSNTIIREIMRVMLLYQNAANPFKRTKPKVISYQRKILNIFVVFVLFKSNINTTLVSHKIHNNGFFFTFPDVKNLYFRIINLHFIHISHTYCEYEILWPNPNWISNN